MITIHTPSSLSMNSLSQHNIAQERVPVVTKKGFLGDTRKYFHILALSALGLFADTAKGQVASLADWNKIPGKANSLTNVPCCGATNPTNRISTTNTPTIPANTTNTPPTTALPPPTPVLPSTTPPPPTVPAAPAQPPQPETPSPTNTSQYLRYQRGEFGVIQTRYVQTPNGVVAIPSGIKSTKGPIITATGEKDIAVVSEIILDEAKVIQEVLEEHTKLALEDIRMPFVRYTEVNNYRTEFRTKGCKGDIQTLMQNVSHGFQSSRGEQPACTGGAFCNKCKKK